jgi:hypothetical protein
MERLFMIKLKNILLEIGDLSAGFYDVTGPLPEAGGKRYTKYKFTTDSGLRYDVVFYYTRADIEVWFETYGNVKPEDPQFSGDKLDMSKTTDRGELYKVMATTFGIINHYLTAKDAGKMFGKHNDGLSPFEMHLYANTDNPPPHPMLRIEPTKEKDQTGGDRDSDKRREKLYLQYFKKQGYKATLVGSAILVDVKKYLNEVDLHSKLSRGHKPDYYQLGTSEFKPFDKSRDDVEENFADGKKPGRKGISKRVGIPKGATLTQLAKLAKAKGEKGRMARWQLNMRRGKKKKKSS